MKRGIGILRAARVYTRSSGYLRLNNGRTLAEMMILDSIYCIGIGRLSSRPNSVHGGVLRDILTSSFSDVFQREKERRDTHEAISLDPCRSEQKWPCRFARTISLHKLLPAGKQDTIWSVEGTCRWGRIQDAALPDRLIYCDFCGAEGRRRKLWSV